MLLSRDFVAHIATEISKRLVAGNMIEVSEPAQLTQLTERIRTKMSEELGVEDRLNEEVREILSQHSDRDRPHGAVVSGDVQEGEGRAGEAEKADFAVGFGGCPGERSPRKRSGDGALMLRLSREKVVRLSHLVTEVLVANENVSFIEDRATIRQGVVDILISLLKDEEQVDIAVRQKITSQKKEIVEGTEEWDVVYRKYYQDEMQRIGVVHQTSHQAPRQH